VDWHVSDSPVAGALFQLPFFFDAGLHLVYWTWQSCLPGAEPAVHHAFAAFDIMVHRLPGGWVREASGEG
jgi:hypothetical protein